MDKRSRPHYVYSGLNSARTDTIKESYTKFKEKKQEGKEVYIHEAVEKAMTEGKLIARKELVGGAKDEYAALKIIVRLPCRMVLI